MTFTVLAARIWWLSEILPGMDYPQFLVFVRAVHDLHDTASPFHGTYMTAPWYTPTSLPIHLTSVLSYITGGSIEAAGKLLLTLRDVGLAAAGIYLLKTLGRPRWAIALLFALIHSPWEVVGGFAAYATAMPLLVLGWALSVRWLERLDARRAIALAACLCATLLWHGIAFGELGLSFAVFWALWRAPSWRARFVSALPTLPALLLFAAWQLNSFKGRSSPPSVWVPPWDAADSIVGLILPAGPHVDARAFCLVVVIGAGLVAGTATFGATAANATMWRIRNPFLALSLVLLAAYLVLPNEQGGVAGVSNRFAYPAALAFVFAWNLPLAVTPRVGVVAAVLGYSAFCLNDIASRFRAFEVETRGASQLIDRLGLHDTLYYWAENRGDSPVFESPNKATLELEQFAAARRGGLPNTSFAGYNNIVYVRFVNQHSPMPGLSGPPSWSASMTSFDYVLVRGEHVLSDARFKRVEGTEGWELYGVCGSHRFPACG